MAENQGSYKKLPGRAAGFLFGKHRLWYGEDHLIAVSSAYASEKYQRFYFRDIGAFVVRRTKTRLIWNIIFGVIAVLCIAPIPIIARFSQSPGTPFTFNFRLEGLLVWIPVTLALICIIINTLKGASCSFWVQTAGGLTRLGAPVRVRGARKVINILSPLIVQAQAERPVSSSAAP